MFNINSFIQPGWKEISYNLTVSMFQIVAGYICTDLMMMVNLHFMGQYTNKYQTAAFGVSWLIIQLIAVPFGLGLTSTLNNQVSQALGQNKLKLSWLYLNFTIWSLFTILIPFFCIIYYNSDFLLSCIIKEETETTIRYAKQMMIPLMLAALILLQAECLKSYLVACKIFKPFPYIYATTLLFHIFMCYILFCIGHLAFQGICVAIIISELNILLQIFYYVYKHSEVYQLFNGVQFKCLILQYKSTYILFFKESIPLIMHTYADFVIFQILSIIAFSLGINETSAQLAFSNTSSMCFKFPISLSIALMSYVGNTLSQNQISLAKQYIKSGLIVFGIVLFVEISAITMFRKFWASIYTSDPEIQSIMLKVLPYFLMGSIFFDGIQGVLTGVLKGVNKQSVASNQTILSYYIIGIPFILILTYCFNLKLIGIWLGFTMANIYLTGIFAKEIISLDYDQQVQLISQRLKTHEDCFDEMDLQVLEQQ